MTKYLAYHFRDDENFISTFDELPLWSASFGLLLLKHLELKRDMSVIDIGSGAGFPLMELASRLGESCTLFGVDPWTHATSRAKQKIKNYGLSNVQLIESSAEKLPFETGTVDLIVSNLGINNFENPETVFTECHRVLKPGGKLALTTNLTGHWKEFYKIFRTTLHQLNKEKLIAVLDKDEEHRGTVESISQLFRNAGFKIDKVHEEILEMKFLDGSAFLNHHFIKVGWLTSWMPLFPKEELEEIFGALEKNLNKFSEEIGGLTLTVPMAFMQGVKIK